LHLLDRRATSTRRLTASGIAAGVVGGLVLAVPLFIYDWAKASHSALELPTAAASWLFGLEHFTRNGYQWWPIVLGAFFLLAFWGALGVAFAGLADRVYHVRTRAGMLALGALWSFVSFMFFWYMLLPIARDGAPFRATAVAPDEFVATPWVWILGFVLAGLATGLSYWRLRMREPLTQPAATTTQQQAA
jgi:hypothetical protein